MNHPVDGVLLTNYNVKQKLTADGLFENSNLQEKKIAGMFATCITISASNGPTSGSIEAALITVSCEWHALVRGRMTSQRMIRRSSRLQFHPSIVPTIAAIGRRTHHLHPLGVAIKIIAICAFSESFDRGLTRWRAEAFERFCNWSLFRSVVEWIVCANDLLRA